MEFEQFYLGCLAHASYLIGSDGEAAVVDPRRDVDEYIARGGRRTGSRIRYVIETHLHADFVSGHRELAERTGAEIVFGAKARARRSPTARSRRRRDPRRARRAALPGDAGPHAGEHLRARRRTERSPEPRHGADRRHALHRRRRPARPGGRPRPDRPSRWPGCCTTRCTGSCSRCPTRSRSIPPTARARCAGRTSRRRRPPRSASSGAPTTRCSRCRGTQFVRMMTADLPEAPAYFPHGRGDQPRAAPPPLAEPAAASRPGAEAVAARVGRGRVVLDVRPSADFGAGHVPGSLNVGLGGQFASWAGTLLDPARPMRDRGRRRGARRARR